MGKDDLQVKGKCYYEFVIHGVKAEKLHWSKVNFLSEKLYLSKVNFLNWLFVSLIVVPEVCSSSVVAAFKEQA